MLRKIFIFVLFLILTSCMTVDVKYMKPAEINIPKDIKTIAILPSGGSSHKDIIYRVFTFIFSNEAVKQRFKLLDKENLDKVLLEQKLYNLDEFDDNTAVKLGNLSGAQAIIVAGFKNLNESQKESKIVITRKYQAADGNNVYKNETVPSILKTITFNLDIRMIDITTGTILHSETIPNTITMEKYDDTLPVNFAYEKSWNADSHNNLFRNKDFPPVETLLENASRKYGPSFARKVAPYNVNESIMFESITGDKTNELFFKYLKSDLFDKAKELLLSSLDVIKSLKRDSDKAKHYYNLGAVFEVIGEYQKAKEYYELSIKNDPTNAHLKALKFIEVKIKDRDKLNAQIGNK